MDIQGYINKKRKSNASFFYYEVFELTFQPDALKNNLYVKHLIFLIPV